ncbi:toll/interleukin-1 receptor domain-containing protein [Ideonella sp. 4Y16]|uniref:toll/interleukin-1 receptor domain-containing protein n=1 Tax=Ideonella alba TaxID=2824118 RepID=UPI001B37FDCF|nr:toll/interleukin-1 receptor domain-containing protein [Ideonella alba]MBQ0943481.1 toll/interleukin-1 receptor domain-containing protein [Ideonella alba]
MSSVFISYRRGDSESDAGRLAENLETLLGKDQVFRDHEDIAPGARFSEVLDQALSRADVAVVVIGPGWLTELQRRAALPERDFVRLEVARALERMPRVIPVLLKGATLPSDADLPPDLHGLSRFQAVVLRNDAAWQDDVKRLARAIGLPYRWDWLAARAAGFLLLLFGGLFWAPIPSDMNRWIVMGGVAAYAAAEAVAARRQRPSHTR